MTYIVISYFMLGIYIN